MWSFRIRLSNVIITLSIQSITFNESEINESKRFDEWQPC